MTIGKQQAEFESEVIVDMIQQLEQLAACLFHSAESLCKDIQHRLRAQDLSIDQLNSWLQMLEAVEVDSWELEKSLSDLYFVAADKDLQPDLLDNDAAIDEPEEFDFCVDDLEIELELEEISSTQWFPINSGSQVNGMILLDDGSVAILDNDGVSVNQGQYMPGRLIAANEPFPSIAIEYGKNAFVYVSQVQDAQHADCRTLQTCAGFYAGLIKLQYRNGQWYIQRGQF